MGPAVSWHVTVRPVFVRSMSPASESTSRCFMMAGSDTGNGFASSLTESGSCASSRASRARRVGFAKAAKVRSRVASLYLTIELSVRTARWGCQAAASTIYEITAVPDICLGREGFQSARVIACLGQQPITEQGDLGEHGRRLGAYDPITLGQRQSGREWPHEAPVDEIPSRECGSGERNALTVNSSIDDHAGTIQH